MKNKVLAVFLFAASTIGAVATVNAATIPSLYNTGFYYDTTSKDVRSLADGQGYPRSVASSKTGTWSWSQPGHGNYGKGYAQVGDGDQIGKSWESDNSTSHWLTLSPDRAASEAKSGYNWVYKFDMTGRDISSANMTLRFLADDKGKVVLNGHELVVGGTRKAWTTVSATGSDFVSGINTLLFRVINSTDGYTGLRVEFLSSSYATPVPAAIWLFGSALVGLAATRRKKATITA